MIFCSMPMSSRSLERTSLSTESNAADRSMYVSSKKGLSKLPSCLSQDVQGQYTVGRRTTRSECESTLFASPLGMDNRLHPVQQYASKYFLRDRQDASVILAFRSVALSFVQRLVDVSAPDPFHSNLNGHNFHLE